MILTYVKQKKDHNHSKMDNIELALINEKSEYDLLIRIVASLFDKYNEEFNKRDSENKDEYKKKKEIIEQFEKVMACIRFEVVDTKELFKENKDNLSLLMEISSSVKLKQEFQILLDSYLDIVGADQLNVKVCEGVKVDINKQKSEVIFGIFEIENDDIDKV